MDILAGLDKSTTLIILASHPSEHGWRGMVWVSNLTAGMCLGQTFPDLPVVPGPRYKVIRLIVYLWLKPRLTNGYPLPITYYLNEGTKCVSSS